MFGRKTNTAVAERTQDTPMTWDASAKLIRIDAVKRDAWVRDARVWTGVGR